MPQAPAAPQGHTPVTSWDEAIKVIAKEYDVWPELALAVAKRESSLDPNARGDGNLPGGSVGLFQLRPAAAGDMGVNREDPLENIVGGVKYLKTLQDRYRDPSTGHADLQKVLMAYNGGADNVDKGSISPAAQAYAAEIIASLSQGVRTAAPAPVASHTPAAQSTPPPGTPPAARPLQGNVAAKSSIQAAPSMGESLRRSAVAIGRDVVKPAVVSMAQSMDPRTPEGRQNLAVTGGTTLFSYAFPPALFLRAGVTPWLARVLAAPAVAGSIAGTEVAVENALGTSTESPLNAAAMQATYELGGQAFMWLPRTAAKDLVASRVGREAREKLTTSLRTTRQSGQAALDTLRTTLRGGVEAVRQEGAAKVGQVKEMGRSATQLAADTSAARLAQVELDAAKRVADITAQYDQLQSMAPSVQGASSAARDVVGGMPGLTNVATGPAKRALDIAGERVRVAAESGPMIDIRPIQTELSQMGAETLPKSILERRAAAAAEAAQQVGGRDVRELAPALQRALVERGEIPASALLPPDHPLPKLLGEFQMEGESSLARDGKIPFIELHKWKTLLDSAVNHDVKARDLVERMTKGLRTKIREAMAVHEPYNVATAAYAKLVPLYDQGIGRELITAAAKDPDKVSRLLNVKEPSNALALRSLLVDQSAAGGDVELGQQAWDAIRARFTYDHVVHGGIEGLADRVRQMGTEHPEFVRAVYGDLPGARVLTNLETIGNAYKQAVEETAQQVARTKAIGKAGVEETRLVASHATTQAQREASEATRRARGRAAEDLTAQMRTNQGRREAIGQQLENLRESSVGPYISRRAGENVAADITRGAALGWTSRFGALSLMRLLRGPRSDELLEWAAYSNDNTKRLVRVILDPAWDRGAAALIRDAMSAVMRPMASHSQAPPP